MTQSKIVYTKRGDDGRHTAYFADSRTQVSASATGWKSATRLWDFLQQQGYNVLASEPMPDAAVAKELGLPVGSAKFFRDLAEDAGNWSGNPWFDGNVASGRSAAGYVGRLVKAGLIESGDDGEGHAFAIFTAAGIDAAAKLGIDLSWITPDSSTPAQAATPEENTMTVTVKRGAGRPAANASRTRHAQRTPLPPKSDHEEPIKPDVPNRTTRARRKAVTGSEESPNPTRPARTSKATPEQAEKAPSRARKAVAERPAATGKVSAKRSAKRTPSATLPEDFPGRSRAMRLLDGPAQEAGWVGSATVTDAKTGAVEVSIAKDGVTMTWWGVDGKQDPNQAPRYSDGSRTVQMKNIAAILAQATGERVWVKPASERSARKPSAKRATVSDEPQRQALPFDAAEASEREVASHLRGKTITWQNRISKAVESAVIATRAKITLDEHPQTGERMVTFNDPVNTGTRTVRLAGILTVK